MPKKSSGLKDALFNVLIPSLILVKFSTPEYLGPLYGLLVALAFPLAYGVKELLSSRKWNPFSVIGLISILLTGGIGLLQLPTSWIAIKEAAIPFALGVFVLFSTETRFSVVELLLSSVVDLSKHFKRLTNEEERAQFKSAIRMTSMIIAASFFMSAILNYTLAKLIVVSEPGTAAFTMELGKLTALSFPVIALPSTLVLMAALGFLFYRLSKLTGLTMEELLK